MTLHSSDPDDASRLAASLVSEGLTALVRSPLRLLGVLALSAALAGCNTLGLSTGDNKESAAPANAILVLTSTCT